MTILQKIRPSIYTVPYGQFCQVSSINQFCTDTFRAPRKKRRLFQSAFSSPSRRLRHAASAAIPAFPAKSRPLRKEAHTGSRRIRFRTQKRGAKMRNLPDEFQGAGRGLLPGRCENRMQASFPAPGGNAVPSLSGNDAGEGKTSATTKSCCRRCRKNIFSGKFQHLIFQFITSK